MKTRDQNHKGPTFAARIRELRTILGFKSDEAFADAMGLKQSYISRWTNSKQGPSADSLCLVARRFQVSVDWLLGLSDRFKLTPR